MNIQPHWAWFLLSPLVLFIGVVVFVIVATSSVTGLTGSKQDIAVPGTGYVTVEDAGWQTLFFEHTGGSSASVPYGLEVQVVRQGGGTPLEIRDPFGSANYTVGRTVGQSFASVNFPGPGVYQITTALPDGTHPPRDAAVVLNTGFGGKFVGTMLVGMAILMLSMLAAIIIPIVVAVKRSKSKQQQQMLYYQQQQAYPPGY
jgi:hypothetical protein